MTELTHERLRDLLTYNPVTGKFFWRMRGGARAGSMRGKYRSITVDGKAHLEHRLAWFYVHGRWPCDSIDHANCVEHDNRLENLREATLSQNMANKPRGRRNKSGFQGRKLLQGARKMAGVHS